MSSSTAVCATKSPRKRASLRRRASSALRRAVRSLTIHSEPRATSSGSMNRPRTLIQMGVPSLRRDGDSVSNVAVTDIAAALSSPYDSYASCET